MDIDLKNWRLVKKTKTYGSFTGFAGDMIYELNDGSMWIQSRYKYKYKYAYRPEVEIYEQAGKTIMYVPLINDYIYVRRTNGFKATVVNEFKGWSGDTLFELNNGQIWKQYAYAYQYQYAHRPEVIIAEDTLHYEGYSVSVRRIK